MLERDAKDPGAVLDVLGFRVRMKSCRPCPEQQLEINQRGEGGVRNGEDIGGV